MSSYYTLCFTFRKIGHAIAAPVHGGGIHRQTDLKQALTPFSVTAFNLCKSAPSPKCVLTSRIEAFRTSDPRSCLGVALAHLLPSDEEVEKKITSRLLSCDERQTTRRHALGQQDHPPLSFVTACPPLAVLPCVTFRADQICAPAAPSNSMPRYHKRCDTNYTTDGRYGAPNKGTAQQDMAIRGYVRHVLA